MMQDLMNTNEYMSLMDAGMQLRQVPVVASGQNATQGGRTGILLKKPAPDHVEDYALLNQVNSFIKSNPM
jgi:hypothetical protein